MTQFNFSQSLSGKRIKIANPTSAELLKVKEVGIDLSCGALFTENGLILELGETDLDNLSQKGISFTVLIDDLIGYYQKKNETELPLAKSQLQAKKAQAFSRKSLSTKSESIDNFIQYEGCSEVNWAVPTNFTLGSMGGCLTYSEVLSELDRMRSLYPNLISVKTDASPGTVTHGNSYTNGGVYDTWAGQPIYYVRISDNPDIDEANEPESLYSGMTHSREVSSMMNLMYYMWYVLENYSTDPGIKNLVDNHEMYFIPVANPDGLMWNEQIAPSGGGMQRKNLGPYNTGNNAQRGVDLNRNYDYFWGPNPIYGGSSGTQSSDVYRGPSAFSEPETQIVRNFSASRNFKTAMNHHATSNLIPHAYNGYPAAAPSGREAEYHKFCHDMTRFNRYIYGEAPDILTIANGDMSDWMLGGAADVNGSKGSRDFPAYATEGVLALAPENGSWISSDGEGGFWPSATKIVEIAQRAMRMNFVNAYHSGKFAQFHDLNPSDIATTSGNLEFGLEYLGQTLGDITLNVTPVSGIQSITPPPTQTGWSKLEQRKVTAAYTLNPGIQPNDEIEFQVTLSNDDGYVMYRANILKIYNPSVLFTDNPDTDNLTNWTASGGSWGTTTDAYSGTTAITDSPSGAYGNNQSKTLTLSTSVDLSSSSVGIVQFFAKWDLERNFDYVQIEGSTNGSTWIPLCGKYSKPGSSRSTNRYSSGNSTNTSTGKSTADQDNQPTGESIYDGDSMDKWVMEEILIDGTENSFLFGATNARFRFVFDSDNTN
ncbi:M14 family metallopeptidase, partial [Jejuia pallidilutea]